VGSCAGSTLGFEGCCSTESNVRWCEDSVLCEIECGDNAGVAQNPPCQASLNAGSCDPDVTQCVCDIDPFCCDPSWGWDEFCVSEVQDYCGGCTACPPPSTSCGWLASEGYYDCRPSA